MFKLDPRESYMMPAHFGPRHFGGSGWYHDVRMMAMPYITDAEKLAAYIPAPYKVNNPVVTVVYACNRQVDWLAGRGYNLVSVNASVVYESEGEHLNGLYTLVMWENLTDPILTGRELQGIPKIYADIPDHQVENGRWSAGASHFGNQIVEFSIENLRPPTADEVAAAAANEGNDHPMAWRYFPAVPGYGEAVNEFTTFPSETIYKEVQVGEAALKWNELTWEQNPTQFHIVNALADLPIVTMLPAMVAKASVNLVLPENPARVLK